MVIQSLPLLDSFRDASRKPAEGSVDRRMFVGMSFVCRDGTQRAEVCRDMAVSDSRAVVSFAAQRQFHLVNRRVKPTQLLFDLLPGFDDALGRLTRMLPQRDGYDAGNGQRLDRQITRQ